MKVSCLCLWKVRELAEKTIITWKEENEVRFREADNEYRRLKEDFAQIARNRRKEITLGVIRQKALHHAEDSLRDVQRTYLSSR